MELTVYLSGEIHTNWREEIIQKCEVLGLPIEFLSPVTDHELSDDVGVEILGKEDKKFWHDHKSAKINSIRTKNAIEQADVVVVRFGDKYKQWNAAFDAGYAIGLSKSLVVLQVLIQGTMDRTLLSSFDEKNFFSTFIEEISALVDEQPDYLDWPEEFSKGRVPFLRQFSSLSWLRDRSVS